MENKIVFDNKGLMYRVMIVSKEVGYVGCQGILRDDVKDRTIELTQVKLKDFVDYFDEAVLLDEIVGSYVILRGDKSDFENHIDQYIYNLPGPDINNKFKSKYKIVKENGKLFMVRGEEKISMKHYDPLGDNNADRNKDIYIVFNEKGRIIAERPDPECYLEYINLDLDRIARHTKKQTLQSIGKLRERIKKEGKGSKSEFMNEIMEKLDLDSVKGLDDFEKKLKDYLGGN